MPVFTNTRDYKGWDSVHIFGKVVGVASADSNILIWSGGKTDGSNPLPAVAAITTIESDDVNDTSDGTGVRTIRIFGLDADYFKTTEDVTMNGTTTVTLTNKYLRVYKLKVLTVGSNETNVGHIDVKHGSTLIQEILHNAGGSESAIYTIPADYQYAEIHSWFASVGKTNNSLADIDMRIRDFGMGWVIEETLGLNSGGASSIEFLYAVPFRIESKSDIEWRVEDVSANNTDIDISMQVLLRPA